MEYSVRYQVCLWSFVVESFFGDVSVNMEAQQKALEADFFNTGFCVDARDFRYFEKKEAKGLKKNRIYGNAANQVLYSSEQWQLQKYSLLCNL